MSEPRAYVVRIYRQGLQTLSGLVEDTRTGGKRPFRDTQELAELLRGPISDRSIQSHKTKSNPTKS